MLTIQYLSKSPQENTESIIQIYVSIKKRETCINLLILQKIILHFWNIILSIQHKKWDLILRTNEKVTIGIYSGKLL